MANFWQKVKLIARDSVLRKRILFVLFILALFRLLATIPVPGVDPLQLQNFLSNNQFFGLLNIFSGGGLSQLSIVMLGVGPYITAVIIMQLLTIMVPQLKALYHEEGDAGRKKFNQYGRLATVPIAIVQGVSLLMLLQRQGVLDSLSLFSMISNILVVVAGAILLMWLGELISEFGIGNGVSILIFAGIVSAVPSQIGQLAFTFDVSQLPIYLGFVVAAVIIVAGVVIMTEAERPVPITYAKQVRGGRTSGGVATYLPLRVNQAGVMPLIFALSILLFPQMIANFLIGSGNSAIQNIAEFIVRLINNGWFYSITYFVLVVAFTYFYTAITFEPESVADNLQKSGAFVPGIRPGASTRDYLSRIVTRITLIGALFLGLIAVLPIIIQSITGIQSFAIGGTALLIVVAVIIDLIKKVDAQVAMREY